jgi:hypothetical protein
MVRRKAAKPKPAEASKQPEPDELKRVLRDAELKKFDPELEKIVRGSRRRRSR